MILLKGIGRLFIIFSPLFGVLLLDAPAWAAFFTSLILVQVIE